MLHTEKLEILYQARDILNERASLIKAARDDCNLICKYHLQHVIAELTNECTRERQRKN